MKTRLPESRLLLSLAGQKCRMDTKLPESRLLLSLGGQESRIETMLLESRLLLSRWGQRSRMETRLPESRLLLSLWGQGSRMETRLPESRLLLSLWGQSSQTARVAPCSPIRKKQAPGCGVKMTASVRLSLVPRSSIGPAIEKASSRPAMHQMCSFGISHFFRTFCGVKMAASARLSLVPRSSIGPARKRKLQACNAPNVQFWHKPFFSNLLRCQNGCFCAFIACASVFNWTCHRKSKLQACNAPNVQFWHKPFFSNFLRSGELQKLRECSSVLYCTVLCPRSTL